MGAVVAMVVFFIIGLFCAFQGYMIAPDWAQWLGASAFMFLIVQVIAAVSD